MSLYKILICIIFFRVANRKIQGYKIMLKLGFYEIFILINNEIQPFVQTIDNGSLKKTVF